MSDLHLQPVEVRDVVKQLETYVAATRVDPPADFVDRLRVAMDAEHDLPPTLSAIPVHPMRMRPRRLTWRTRPGLLAAAALTTLLAGGAALGAAGGSLWPEPDNGPLATSDDGPTRPPEDRTGIEAWPGDEPPLPAADDPTKLDTGNQADEVPVPEPIADDDADDSDISDDDSGTEHQGSDQANDADGENLVESEAEADSDD